jgi:hypothetical protein
MIFFRDKTFIAQSVDLDDTAFLRCKFKDCDIYYSGLDYELKDCNIDSCQFHFTGWARNTFGLLASIGGVKPDEPGQRPKIATQIQ